MRTGICFLRVMYGTDMQKELHLLNFINIHVQVQDSRFQLEGNTGAEKQVEKLS